MNERGTVNSQVLDSVAQEATAVLGQAPAETTGMLDAVMAETIGMAMYNAVTTQHNSQMVASAAIAATCARMLRIPGALPLPFRVISPTVIAINPTPVWASTNNQQIQVIGTNFQPNLSVDVFAPDGSKAGTLTGGQITGMTVAAFTMTSNLFSQEGNYGIEVVNPGPDGGRSSRYQIAVEVPDPQISGIALPTGSNPQPNTYVVSGSNFQAGVTAKVFEQNSNPVSGTTVIPSSVTPTSFTVSAVLAPPLAIFSIQAVNPDGGTSNLWPFQVPATQADASQLKQKVADHQPPGTSQ